MILKWQKLCDAGVQNFDPPRSRYIEILLKRYEKLTGSQRRSLEITIHERLKQLENRFIQAKSKIQHSLWSSEMDPQQLASLKEHFSSGKFIEIQRFFVLSTQGASSRQHKHAVERLRHLLNLVRRRHNCPISLLTLAEQMSENHDSLDTRRLFEIGDWLSLFLLSDNLLQTSVMQTIPKVSVVPKVNPYRIID